LSNFSTILLPIIFCSDIDYINKNSETYSYAFRSMYKRIEESSDINIINHYKTKYNLTDIGYRSLVNDVKSTISSLVEIKKNKLNSINIIEKEIEYLTKNINELENKKDKKFYKLKFNRYKLYKKLDKIKSSIENNIIFGGRNVKKNIK